MWQLMANSHKQGLFETGSLCLSQAALKLSILLPQCPEGLDFRCLPTRPAMK